VSYDDDDVTVSRIRGNKHLQ